MIQYPPPDRPPTPEQFYEWLSALARFNAQLDVSELTRERSGNSEIRARVNTGLHRYDIYAIFQSERNDTNSGGHMGCIANRHDGTGGNDLYDGPLNILTWTAILADIVAFEAGAHQPEQPPTQRLIQAA